MGFDLLATRGTAERLQAAGIDVQALMKVQQGHPNVLDYMIDGNLQLVFNTPSGKGARTDEGRIRAAAVVHGIPCITTLEGRLGRRRRDGSPPPASDDRPSRPGPLPRVHPRPCRAVLARWARRRLCSCVTRRSTRVVPWPFQAPALRRTLGRMRLLMLGTGPFAVPTFHAALRYRPCSRGAGHQPPPHPSRPDGRADQPDPDRCPEHGAEIFDPET